jgi:prephenate dehydrogenase
MSIAELVIIAISVDATLQLLPRILDIISDKTVVMDVGSTKNSILESIKNHSRRRNFVATHPMSGTENSGPSAAFSGLFKGKVAIICDQESSYPWAVKEVEEFYKALESNLIYMDGKSHDEHVGYVSHLSHVISYALAVSVLEKKSTATIFDLAAGGFASTARLAKSSAEMWSPIFEQNADSILPILEIYISKLNEFSSYLKEGKTDKVTEFIKEANRIRKVLDKRE